jgi:hypothetical protein
VAKLDAIAELQRMIDASPSETLQDAAVKLRRLSAYIEQGPPAGPLAGALGAVERAAVRSTLVWPGSAYQARTTAFRGGAVAFGRA